MKKVFLLCLSLAFFMAGAQHDTEWDQKFEQLGTSLPTPNSYRTASGAPGKDYWQQKADYKMDIRLDDSKQRISGDETITYYNQSPDELPYLWLQLDQNMRAKDSDSPLLQTGKMQETMSAFSFRKYSDDFDGGFDITAVTDANGNDLRYMINKTMMRIDLPKPLASGASTTFKISWAYNVNNRLVGGGRSGLEYFPEDDNYLYTIAQFFPRMAVYDDVEGWQNKQFLGRGEFALTFGDYEVDITVPSDFIVGASGTLQNAGDVLTSEQMERFEKAQNTFDKPVMIVTEKEAKKAEKSKASGTKTWSFKADNVRDFAFCASRKFIWDAMAVQLSDNNAPLAMSYYPKEGNPLWEEYSTLAVAQTLKTYSKHTIEYPYPVAISVHTASIGMEYPMICFNFGRPNKNGKYTDAVKRGMISVIIHEVGHNFFPMIINSDERQWTWMDEGLNTFMQYLTEQEWDPEYPSRRGPAANIVPYMRGDNGLARPIMTNSEQIRQFGANAYAKPATALNILRETVMGPELFDYAFKTYAERWAFKHPSPADFFRTMEDASAVDLDWFWKGWFYTTDYVDVSVENVKWYRMENEENGLETRNVKVEDAAIDGDGTANFGDAAETFVFQGLKDEMYRGFRDRLNEEKIQATIGDKNFYEVTFKNNGGLVTPLLIEWTYEDGSKELEQIPAEIWKINEKEISKIFTKDKKVTNIVLDPNMQTADTNTEDNVFPRQEGNNRFDQFKSKGK
ncbi:MAG: M1 family metallopeptidase [Cytophagales bacterium]|nr:M1 family metallopeptidase [Cytophagales bacterium]